MNIPNAKSPLFRYMLRELTPDEEWSIESRLHTDDNFRDQLEAAENELIIAYVRGGLTKYKCERFENYYLCSEERIKKLRLAEELYKDTKLNAVSESGAPDRFDGLRQWLSDHATIRPVLIYRTLAAALVVGLGMLIWSLVYQSTIAKGLNNLRAAYSEQRPIEARISDFNYARYKPSQNGEDLKFDRRKRDIAYKLIIVEADEKQSLEANHALGKLYLTEKDFNESVKYFEIALKSDDHNAKVHNDLAIALMEREKAKKPGLSTGEDFAQALEHLHRAIELDGSFLDAHFNLALCHQYQKLWRTAEEDWKKYLEKDSQSPWAEEARKNLGRIEGQIKNAGNLREQVQKNFQEAYQRRDGEEVWQAYKHSRLNIGSFITDRLIDDYLSLALSGKSTEAGDKLQALVFLGDIEFEKVGDRFTYDLAQIYRGSSLQQLQKLSEARGLVKSAYEFYGKSLLDEAINRYLQAKELFNRTGDIPEALMAQYWLGHCYYRQANTKFSLSTLTQSAQDCERRAYTWLLSMSHNDMNNVHVRLTTYSQALDHAQHLLAYAKRIEDDRGILRGLNRIMDTYLLLARYRDSLPIIQEGLSLADEMRADANQMTGLYAGASISYLALGKFRAAMDYQEEALKLGLEINNPWLISRYYTHLGIIHSKLNQSAEAIKLIRSGEEIGKKLNNQLGREIRVYSQLHLGQIYREIGDLDNSAKSYREVLELSNENDIDIPGRYYSAKRGILLTHLKQGDDAATEEELNQLIDWYEQQRHNIEDERSRNSFFDHEQGIYDIAIEFAFFKKQNNRRAFDYSEMSRARSLRDTIDLPIEKLPEGAMPNLRLPYTVKPLSLDQIQERLPEGSYLLQYAVLDDKLIVWAVSKTDLKSRFVNLKQDELNNKVNTYLQLLADGLSDKKTVDHRTLSSELYSLLINPILPLIPRAAEICIIPDKILNRLPFASLISPAGKYLIEERTIFTSPSANMFVVSTDKARQKEGVKAERLLSIGNPLFDKDLFRNLADLPWAADQASKIATFYQAPAVLLERNAREGTIRRELEKSDVAHLAMHYLADERTPLLSALVLAEEKKPTLKDRDGRLQTFELYQMNLSRLRLAVLSACQTGIEEYYRGEGAIGLARAFQGAGIPLVVASLWPVESYPTRELMISFHKHRKSDGLPTAQALRQAQLDMINSSDPELRKPYHWSVYMVIGGHANF